MLLAVASPAQAEDRHWDANGTSVGTGGTGVWNLGNLNWSPSGDGVSGPYIAPWDNAALDNAIFGGTAGTVTLGAPITVHNLTFNVGGYVLTGGTLTLAGVNPTISTIGTNTGAIINSIIAGSSGLTKAGAGALTLNGANTFTGDIFLNAGSLNLNGDAALGAAANRVVTSNGTSLNSIGALDSSRIVELSSGMTNVSGAGVGSARFTGSGGLVARGNGITLSNNANDFTGQASFIVDGHAFFTSVGDVGEASALGAGGTIRFTAQNQYHDRLYYEGTGSSSNRGWEFATSGGTSGSVFINSGTGTLSLTGDIAMIGGASTFVYFGAQTADMDLLGVISSSSDRPVGFGGGSVNRTITLGGANTYSGLTEIGAGGTVGLTGPVTVRASVLADTGEVSSFGTGTAGGISISNGSVLSYIGGGASSNRAWTIGPAPSATGFGGALLNDGTGALALSGAVALTPSTHNGLLLGGSFAGTNTLSGVISGNGKLGSSGSGTWVLSGANTRTGAIVVEGGTLRADNASAFGTTTGVTVNGGTLDLNGYDLETPTLEGTGGEIALGAGTLTVNTTESTSFAGAITGTGGLAKIGAGTLTLAGANSYTGDTSLSGGGITLDFSAAGAPIDGIISADSTLNLAGGRLMIVGGGADVSQSFDGLNISAGSNQIAAASSGSAVNVNFGAINRTGGLVNFVLPTNGSFTTSSAALGGWATVNGSDYAKVVDGAIVGFEEADYTNKDDASTWDNNEVISDTAGAADSQFHGILERDVQLGGLRYTAAAHSTVTATGTLGVDGTIIVAPSTLGFDQRIQGGILTGASGGGTFGVQQNGTGRFYIDSTITDNLGAISFVKGGQGTVRLTGLNSYTGGTTLSGGRLEVSNLADGGADSSIGAAGSNAENLVLESGTFAYVGASDAVTDRGFTLVNGGAENPQIEVAAGRTVEFSGQVTSPDDAGLTKTGWGTLVLSNAANEYIGVTTITGGGGGNSTLSVGTLADGDVASGIGAASSDSANLVMSQGGRLQYTGDTVAINRGFTLESGSGGIDVTQATTTLTISGAAVGAGAFVKEGAGTLVLGGVNTYAGNTAVNGGVLRAGSATAFGPGTGYMTVNGGATLDLGGFDITTAAVAGAGTITLGANRFTTTGGNAIFTGRITGAGGFTRGAAGGTQTMLGCNNDYTGATTVNGTLAVDCLANGGLASGIGAASSDPANLVINGTLVYSGGSVTINRGFTSSGGQIVVDDAAATLEFTGATTGAGFIKDGAGTLVLSGGSTRNGTTQIDNGTLRAGGINAFGSGRVHFANAAGATLDLAGYDTTVGYLTGGGTMGGNVTLGDATLTLNWSSGSADYAGAISGSGGLIKNSGIVQSLTGCDSDYTGSTVINGGGLAVSCLTDGGVNSSIGASGADAGNLVLNGGTLRYIGTGGSTDRQFTLGASAGNGLDASGTGAIEFTSAAPITFAVANGAQTLTLTGTNTGSNVLAAQIIDNGTGVTSLAKAGAGTWILTNPGSNYTGVTTISGGVLRVDKLSDGGVASSIGASSAAASNLVIGNGSTLRYTGAGDTTNRLFTLAAGTSFIESSGTGAVVFTDTGPVTLNGNNQVRTIALGGTNTGNNTLAGAIGDAGTGATTLAKNGSGNWVLTGNNTFSGNTVINDGNLTIGNGGTTGNAGTGNVFVTSAASTLSFNRSDAFNFTGTISGDGGIAQIGTGTTVLTAANRIETARVDDGVLQVNGALGTNMFAMNGDGALIVNGTLEGRAAGSVSTFTGDAGASMITVNAGGTLRASGDLGGGNDALTLAGTLATGAAVLNLGDGDDVFTLNDGGVITGAGVDAGAGTDSLVVNNAVARILNGASVTAFESLTKQSSGVLTLTGDHGYSSGTTIAAGTLQIGNGGASGTLAGNIANNGALAFNRSDTLTIAGAISGTGSVNQLGSGTTILTADNSYAGGTTITAGTLQLGNGGTSGSITGNVANNGSLIFNRSDDIGFGGLISGTGAVTQDGSAIVTLTAANSYSGATLVNAGTLLINGDQSLATGSTSVASGATLGGIGTIGGDVSIANGGILTAGSNGVGTLNIAGGLTLDSGSILNMDFGRADVAGGALNDLIEVGGDLALNGATINVTVPTGGSFGPGIYRVFNYGGELLNDELDLGTLPGGSDVSVQTSITGQVNLVNSAGLSLSFWDGDAGPKFNDIVNGGNGTWHVGGTDNNWTNADGSINAAYADGTFAIFAGTGGTVAVDNGSGAVTASGMQFASDGYLINGDALTLTGPQSIIQVGDSSVAGAGFTATIGAELTGTTQLVKTDAGTLVLTGTNSYTGGTAINGGTLRIASDGNLGAAAGGLSFNGGTLNTTANMTTGRAVTLAGAGTFLTDAVTTLTLTGGITGPGMITKSGTGTLLLTGDATHSGGTTIAAGTLQVGNGGTTGSIAGNIANNGALVFNRSDDTSFAGAITGTGSFDQTGGGVLRLTGDSDYSGTTLIESSELRLENGGSINSGVTALAGPDATLSVTGAGSSFTTTQLVMGNLDGGATTLNIDDGGQVILTGTTQVNLGGIALPSSPALVLTVNVSGAGSLWDVAGNVSVGHHTGASARVNVTDGATVRSGGLSLGPVFLSMTNPSDVMISGAGSSWTASSLSIYRGELSVLDGGRLDAASGLITAAINSLDGQGRVIISGTDSELAIAGALDVGGSGREAIVTVSDGGQLSAGGLLTLGNIAAGSGTLNIGAAAGDAAAAAGTVNAANIAFGPGVGTINFNHTGTAYDFGSAMSGTGTINQLAGVTLLSGDSAGFSGLTSVSGGSLYVNNALGGVVSVATGGTLGGIGTIGGNVTVADGTINPGDLGTAPDVLTINGNLVLASNSALNYNFGQANVEGGPLNDLINVGGDLNLEGTLNVQTSGGGSFDPGVYRVINYAGDLTGSGLTIGTIPSPDFYVQTSVDKQVNLVNTSGLTMRFWDGFAGAKNDDVITGGDGLWQTSSGNDNWTEYDGSANAPFTDQAFAVFSGVGGTVTIDSSLGAVNASGMQFASDGYLIEGEDLTLVAPQSIIRVGDGTTGGAAYTATIASNLTSVGDLIKSDLGTLVLTGTNGIAGDVGVRGGELRLADGGTITSVNGIVAVEAGDEAIMTVAGSDGSGNASTWTVGTDLQVGYSGNGTLNIVDGGRVVSNAGQVGLDSNGIGQVLVSGTGSSWENSGRISVGLFGAGVLRIENGATVTSNDGIVGGSEQGDVIVSGTGTSWVNTQQLNVGSFGAGTMRIENGASVTSNQGYIGANAAGSVTVTGTGSNWLVTDFSMTVGNEGAGSLTIDDGGRVRAEGGFFLGVAAASNGTVALLGTSGNRGVLETSRIRAGTGTVNFTMDGGLLRATADNDDFFVDFGTRDLTLGVNGGVIDTNGHDVGITPRFVGTGGLIKDGLGTLTLAGASNYAGATLVNAGTLIVNGDQSGATGLTTVLSGATLGGTGTIGGNVAMLDGAILAPGVSAGTLTINGNLSLAGGSILDYEFGQANVVGGALNDLVNVGGNLTLDGTIDVTVPTGGSFGPGIYRVLNYGGALTNNGLSLGIMPGGSTVTVQTSVAGQVNLVNTDGLALNFWDGAAGPKFNAAIDGGDGLWQNGIGNDNWTNAEGAVNAAYADGAFAIFAGTGGTVTIDNSLGQVSASGMQFAANDYIIKGDALELTGPQAIIHVGDGSTAGAAFTATIASEVAGATQLVKIDAGTLILSGNNSYTGGTAIEGGSLAISADANLGDAAGTVSIGGGTLQTTANLVSDRAFAVTGEGTILTDQGTTFTLAGTLSGAGALTKAGAGTLLLTGDSSGYVAASNVAGGTLAVDGRLGSAVTIVEAGRLEGTGRVGSIVNGGVVAPGRGGIGTLTVAGDYVGNGGTLAIEAVLGDDSSATSRLVVNGTTSGNTQVSVINRDGLGGQTIEGIKIIDVAGASNGTFALNGDYVFNGEQAVIGGAYGYRLYQGGVASPTDGDWYLRSSLLDPTEPVDPDVPTPPLYQPGAPIYEAYGANLQALNGLQTLQQRVGNRSWAAGVNPEGSGIWGRMEGTRSRANAAISTSFADQNVNSWRMQLGADHVLAGTGKGERLVAGVTAYYGEANSHVRSIFGNGSLKTDGYGLGATLTWYGLQGFYLDSQTQFSWYKSDLNSDVLGGLVRNNDGSGEAFSVEAGKRTPIGGKLSITPQLQMAYSNVRFDRFVDPSDAIVAAGMGDSLKSRAGISLDRQSQWDNGSSHIYGLVNLSYEWLDGTSTRVSGTPIDYANERLWGELGLGASVSWTKGVTLYGEVSGNSPFRDFGDSYTLKANAGVRIAF